MSDSESEESENREYASPPCFMHELTPDYDPQSIRSDVWSDVVRWRKSERARLINERLAIDADERRVKSEQIASALDPAIGRIGGRVVSLYWLAIPW